MTQPSYDLLNYRFYDDDNTGESDQTALGTGNNQSLDRQTGTTNRFCVRIELYNDNSKSGVETFQWEYSYDGGAWTDITTSSNVIRAYDSSLLTDEENCTQRLSSSTPFLTANIGVTEDGLTGSISVAAGDYLEQLLSCYIVDADVADNKAISIRVTEGTGDAITYTNTPSLTVDKASTPVSVNLNAASSTISGQVVTIIPATANITLDAATLTAIAQIITIDAPVILAIDNAAITASGQITSIIPDAAIILFNAAALTTSGQATTIVPSAVTINLAYGNLSSTGQSISIISAVAIELATATSTVAGQVITIDASGTTNVDLNAASITASGQSTTIVPATAIISLDSGTLTATGQITTIITAIYIELDAGTLAAAEQVITIITAKYTELNVGSITSSAPIPQIHIPYPGGSALVQSVGQKLLMIPHTFMDYNQSDIFENVFYKFRATWNNADDQQYINGQVLDISSEGVEDGDITLLETEGGIWNCTNHKLYWNLPNIGWNDMRAYSEALTRSFGMTMLYIQSFPGSSLSAPVGFHYTQALSHDTGAPTAWLRSVITLKMSSDYGDTFELPKTITFNTEYRFALVLGGYDINGVPWHEGETQANYLYGNAIYFMGGIYTDWELLWRGQEQNTSTLYAGFTFGANAGMLDMWHVPEDPLPSVLQPTALSTFTADDDTSLDAITPEVGGSWTEWQINILGDYDIQGNSARCFENEVAIQPKISPATVNTSESDVMIDVITTPNIFSEFRTCGLITRLSNVNNYWYVALNPYDDLIEIIEVNGGARTTRASTGVTITVDTSYDLRAIVDSQNIDAFVDGGNKITYGSASLNENETKHGVGARIGIGDKFDNFAVYPIRSATYENEFKFPAQNSIPYHLQATWNNAHDQNYSDEQVLGRSDRGVEEGSLTIVEVDGIIETNNNHLKMSGKISNAWNGVGFYDTDGQTRSLGLTLLAKVRLPEIQATYVGWNDAQNVDSPWTNEYAYNVNSGVFLCDSSWGNNVTLYPAIIDTDYELALVLGGYTDIGSPWYPGAIGTFIHGCSVFIKGGTFTNWTLLWRVPGKTDDTLYPTAALYRASGAIFYVDDFRVPDQSFENVLQPTAFSTFDAPNSTSLDAITLEVGGGWTEQSGDWEIQEDRAVPTGSDPDPTHWLATVETYISDIIVDDIAQAGTVQNKSSSVIVRFTNMDNFWRATIIPSQDQFKIYESNGGIVTQRAFIAVTIDEATDYDIRIIADGQTIDAFCDGGNKITYNLASLNESETKHGVSFICVDTDLENFEHNNFAVYPRTSTIYDAELTFPTQSSVPYHLRATWDAASDQGYADTQVLDTLAEGVSYGSLTVKEISGSLACVDNECDIVGGATQWDNLGFLSQAITKILGHTLLGKINLDATTTYSSPIGWQNSPNLAALDREYIFSLNNSLIREITSGGSNMFVGAYSAATDYQFAIVLGGYDSNGIPWRIGETEANYLYGAELYVKGGIYTTWTKLWKNALNNTATLYAAFNANSGSGTLDDFRVTAKSLKAVLQPTAFSTFTADDDTSLDAITPEVGSGWTEQDANFSITSNKAVYTGTAQDGVAYVETSEADILTDITVDTTVVASRKGLCIRRSIDGGVGANRWEVYCISGTGPVTTTSYIVENNNGERIARASDTGLSIAYPNDLRCITDGDVIDLFINGGNKLSYVSATFNSTATEHGILIRDNAGVAANGSLDNFAVYPRTSTTYDNEFETV